MSSLDRPLTGDVLVLDLDNERREAADASILGQSGRSARTLLKDGGLRVTLIVLAPGGKLAEHRAEGPITIQPLDGRIRFTAGEASHEIGPGELLFAGPGVTHEVSSDSGGSFLLSVTLPPR